MVVNIGSGRWLVFGIPSANHKSGLRRTYEYNSSIELKVARSVSEAGILGNGGSGESDY